ncbi:NACHT and WD domain-containing protein [Colletotrichum costaricense]|uniref:NACHT and WD domain-containing protein n=1 Tax=Colletotrichum costaricense TaxID=1209916 RepID=A0AAI9YWC5_9PEZI|nr:NACHT and WD domain-containing protein [Colletotrichum costaricense]KAK1527060.1 NACHT and WD domain-containing protein [Colletotrichum costaricense]
MKPEDNTWSDPCEAAYDVTSKSWGFASIPTPDSHGTFAPLENVESQAFTTPSRGSSFSVPASLTTSPTPRVDQDPVGLKVIHRPVGRPIADIIFVHGLGGGSRKSWSKGHNPDNCWPKNFLPSEPVVRDARLLTFGYNANFGVGEGKTMMSILDFAKDLLYDMKYAKDEVGENLEDLGIGECPIIFVVHSMGGLVVKEAYLQGQNDPIFEHIIERISSIVFMSTPHRGTNLASLLHKVLQVSFGASSRQFITELVAGFSTLEKVNENFRHAARKLQIVSFYETRPTPVSKLSQMLATSNPSYAAKLRVLETAGVDFKSADYRTLWLWLFKQSLLSLRLNHPIYFVLDGLDEADSPGSVIRLLSELSLAAVPLRVLVISRKTPDIATAFSKMSRQVRSDAISLEGSTQDFRVYIEQEMDVAGDDMYREEVTAQLLERAGGNFLWVHLAVQKINDCHTKLDVQNALEDLPSGMEALCMAQLSDPTIRSQFNRKRPPAFLDYAIRFWFIHLSRASVHGSTEVLATTMKFLNSPSILTWIYLAVRINEMRLLVTASRYLTDMVVGLRRSTAVDESLIHRQTVRLVEGWATDLVKIVGKFGSNLRQSPDAIDKLIPPFCPQDSAIYEQFGSKEGHSLQISGSLSSAWDDCLTRLSFEQGASASAVLAAGNCLQVAKNPMDRPRPHSLRFIEDDQTVLVANEDRCIRRLSVHSPTDPRWTIHSEITEQRFEGTIHSFPNCSALSPDGTMVVFGYRAHPVAAWELDPPKMLRQCHIPADEANISSKRKTVGEVYHLRWHPYSGEVLGLTQIGLMFKWDPFEEETRLMVGTGANKMVVSRDGSLIATGDPRGTIKIFATADFSLLYQLSSQDFVNDLAFSSDSRRLYDMRGPYGNVWEPNTLIRLSDSSEVPDHNSDATGETESLAKMSLLPEHQSARVNSLNILSSQPQGALYCFGTDNGLVDLCENGNGTILRMERLSSRMSVTHMAWSDDGRRIALANRARRLWIKTVSQGVDDRQAWKADSELNVILAPQKGRATGLLFQTAGQKLCARTPSMLLSVDLETQHWTEAELPKNMEQCKWINHPTKPEYLLAFGPSKVRVFQWSTMRQVGEQRYSQPHLVGPCISPVSPTEGQGDEDEHYTVGRLLAQAGSSRILLQLLSTTVSNRLRHRYFLFDVNELRIKSRDENGNSGEELVFCDSSSFACVALPTRIASRIREPLSLMPRQKLIFLDVERWVCTWRLPHFSPTSTPLEAADIQRYYFLPGDWATADEAHRCVVMADGTLLCPRNGGVAAVQCADL